MTNFIKKHFYLTNSNKAASTLASASIWVLSALFTANAIAASPVLATQPLTSTTSAKANLMFVLDNSGSMEKNYVSTALNDDLPPLMRHGGQCKGALKGQSGEKITVLEKDGDKLKITVSGGNFTKQDIVYLALPNRPQYSGVYKIKESNFVASVGGYCATPIMNTTIRTNNPYTFGDTGGYWYGPLENRQYRPPCSYGPAISNIQNFTSNRTVNGTNPNTGVATNQCGWFDPKDDNIGTYQTGCSNFVNGSTGVNGRQLEVELDDDSGADGLLNVTDAYLTMSRDFNTASPAVTVGWNEWSDCSKYEWSNDNSLYGWEPPQSSAQINNLFYNPEISYAPPPWPNKFALAAPANMLPSMTSAYTSAWTKVPRNGLELVGGNPIAPASAVTDNLTTTRELVFCDTPRRPTLKVASNPASGAFANDKEWLESSRCKHNNATSNTVANSPSYPYQYPAKTTGSSSASPFFYQSAEPHQHGDTSLGSANPIAQHPLDAANPALYAYGQYYYDAKPHYFNVKPIEHCTTPQLTSCVVGPKSATHPYPSYVRYCKDENQAANVLANPVVGQCQKKFTGQNWTGVPFGFARYGLFERVDIKPGGTYAVDPTTSKVFKARHDVDSSGNVIGDCASDSGCTYNEEMTNYANWYAYYRTRIQLMKSATAHAFNPLGDGLRVGLMTINEPVADDPSDDGTDVAGKYLQINDFTASTSTTTGHKQTWLEALYAVNLTLKTPLREALANVGRVYAGKATDVGLPAGDPVQHSCQQNFTLLTTDGYWNGPAGKTVSNLAVNNRDNGTTARPQFDGNLNPATNTLADVAQYYYLTDLRDNTAFNNCTGGLGIDVCFNDVKTTSTDGNTSQHMTTYTLGLGVDGDLNYRSDYKDASSGDFKDITVGSKNWPIPVENQASTVDDLWHAAVNGRGTYYSAKSTTELNEGISKLLTDIKSIKGSASAVSLSDITPDVGGAAEYAYIAQYEKGDEWSGNLYARELILSGVSPSITASLSKNVSWCVENLAAIPHLTRPVDGCVPSATTGLATKVAANSDTRNIYTNVGGSLVSFAYGNLTPTQKSYFETAHLSANLSQWSSFTADQQSDAVGANLVKYLRGQTGFDDRSTNDLGAANNNRLFRLRNKILGDIVESDPEYVGKSEFSYLDTGHAAYVTSTAGRAKTVFVGANDGMLHAFNADTGEERWAFVPNTVIPNLWKLADKNYQHANYINGEMTIADIQVGGTWKTILVSGFGQGGRGYFALDITDTANPSVLWEVNSDIAAFSDMGYSYGKPVVAKKSDGTWVVLLTSGYNNTAPGDGKGRLYVVNANNGTQLANISTGVGDITTPSGLAQVAPFGTKLFKNNEPRFIYGGDLLGNVWRFDINANTVMKLTNLVSAGGEAQPITVAPTVTDINNKPALFIGTGKYLEAADRLPANYKTQTLYAFKDSLIGPIANLRSTLIKQELTSTGTDANGAQTKGVTDNAVDWKTNNGWYIDLIDAGERQVLKSKLANGVLTVGTLVPPTGSCDPNGRGWKYILNYRTGSAMVPGANVGVMSSASIVGLTVIFIEPGVATIDISNDATVGQIPPGTAPEGVTEFQGNRGVWRELIE